MVRCVVHASVQPPAARRAALRVSRPSPWHGRLPRLPAQPGGAPRTRTSTVPFYEKVAGAITHGDRRYVCCDMALPGSAVAHRPLAAPSCWAVISFRCTGGGAWRRGVIECPDGGDSALGVAPIPVPISLHLHQPPALKPFQHASADASLLCRLCNVHTFLPRRVFSVLTESYTVLPDDTRPLAAIHRQPYHASRSASARP